MNKSNIFTKKFYLLSFLVFFLTLFTFKVYKSYHTAVNVNHIYLKIYTNDNSNNIKLYCLSNIGNERTTHFEYDVKDGIWKLPNFIKRNIVDVQIVKNNDVIIDSVKYATTTKDYANAEFLNYKKVSFSKNNNNVSLNIPSKGSILSNYENVINWGGDFSLILYPFLNSVATCLVFFFFLFLIKYRDYFRFNFHYRRTDIFFLIFSVLLLMLLFYLNNRNNSMAILSLRDEDEFIILPIFKLFENPYVFLNSRLFYGVLNYILVVPFVLYGIVTESFEAVITGARMLSATAAVFSLTIIYQMIKNNFTKVNTALVILFFISIPAFWLSATLIRPEWLMTFFMLVSIKFLLRTNDNQNFINRDNIVSILCFGIALAVKFHAIIFTPLYFLPYIKVWKVKSMLAILATLVLLLGTFITFKFELFFKGFDKEIEGLIFQAWNQKTGNAVGENYKIVTVAEKLQMINSVFFPLWLFVGFILSSIWMSLRLLKENKIYLYLNIAIIIILIYYAVFVNKDWPNYYITPLLILVLVWFLQINILMNNKKLLSGIILMALVANMFTYQQVYSKILSDYHMPPSSVLNELLEGNQFIKQNLSISEPINMLVDYGISKDYESFSNVKVNWLTVQDGLEIQKNKLEWLNEFNFVVLRKDKSVFSEEVSTRLINKIVSNGLVKRFENNVMAVYYKY
jgi:4-amino-4-deoxy-L-arabinose transferase-like glycosyltransferase